MFTVLGLACPTLPYILSYTHNGFILLPPTRRWGLLLLLRRRLCEKRRLGAGGRQCAGAARLPLLLLLLLLERDHIQWRQLQGRWRRRKRCWRRRPVERELPATAERLLLLLLPSMDQPHRLHRHQLRDLLPWSQRHDRQRGARRRLLLQLLRRLLLQLLRRLLRLQRRRLRSCSRGAQRP